MLRHLLIAGTALILATTGASATTPATWQGGFIITSLTDPACNGTELKVGKTQLATFRAKLNTGELNSAIAFFFTHGALLVTVHSPAIPPPNSGPYTGVGVDPLAGGGQYTGGTYAYTFTPKASMITASTPQVTIVGSITQFGNLAGCNVGFKGVFFLMP